VFGSLVGIEWLCGGERLHAFQLDDRSVSVDAFGPPRGAAHR